MNVPDLSGCKTLTEAEDLVWGHLDPESRHRDTYLGVGHYNDRTSIYLRDDEHPGIALMRDATGIWMRLTDKEHAS